MRDVYRPYGRARRRWSGLSWWYSVLLIAPLIGILISALIQYDVLGRSGVEGRVLDAYTEQPIPEARVIVGDEEIFSGSDGRFRVHGQIDAISVQKDGYDPAVVTVTPGQESLEVRLRPNVVQGTVTARGTGEPIPRATIEAMVDERAVASALTESDGTFFLVDIPAGARLVIDSPDHAAETVELGQATRVEVELRPDVVIGQVRDSSGAPVAGAMVAIGDARAESDEQGTFRLEGAPESGEVVVKRSGYRAWTGPLDESMRVTAQLEPLYVRALYATADTAARPERLGGLIEIIERTEANALVVDLKDSSGFVFYDTQVELAHEIGAVRPVLDPRQITDMLRERGIYSIARIVVFEDPILATARPEWAIRDNATGDLWRTWSGLAWVNAHRREVWAYNTALAREAAELGFDEIQLDYIRFPTDGPLNRAEYGVEHNAETRSASIRGFLAGVHEALAPTPAYLGVDIFGLTLWELGDGGIGQNLETIIEVVDYVCPMIYPSHFYPGSMGFDIPNDHPYEVILWSLQNGLERIPGHEAKMRPWLQDFSYGPGIRYGDAEVRAQIQATEETASSGWMLWNAASVFHEGALRPR